MWNVFKINNKNNRRWRRSGDFIVDFEHIPRLFLVFLLLTFISSFWYSASQYSAAHIYLFTVSTYLRIYGIGDPVLIRKIRVRKSRILKYLRSQFSHLLKDLVQHFNSTKFHSSTKKVSKSWVAKMVMIQLCLDHVISWS